jgi:hypothetical protein
MSDTRHLADDLINAVIAAERWIDRNSFEHGLAAAMEADALARRAVEHLRDTTQSQAEHEQCLRWLEER